MKAIFSILFFTSLVFAFGQSTEDWILFQNVEGVEFYKKETECSPENIPAQTGVLIKLVNTNNYAVEASWNLRIWYNGKEQTSNIKDDENHIVQPVGKKATIQGNCDNPNGNLYIFKKFITFSGGAEMSNFQFEEIKVEKVK